MAGMRAFGGLVLVCVWSSVAAAGPKDAIDISAYKADLVVLTDDDGTVYVARPRIVGRPGGPVFGGDGKTFYQQLVISGGLDGSKATWNYGLWAPRVPGYDDATLWVDDTRHYYVACGQGGTAKTELRALGKKEADKMLA